LNFQQARRREGVPNPFFPTMAVSATFRRGMDLQEQFGGLKEEFYRFDGIMRQSYSFKRSLVSRRRAGIDKKKAVFDEQDAIFAPRNFVYYRSRGVARDFDQS
jgi:hypothetical protein